MTELTIDQLITALQLEKRRNDGDGSILVNIPNANASRFQDDLVVAKNVRTDLSQRLSKSISTKINSKMDTHACQLSNELILIGHNTQPQQRRRLHVKKYSIHS